MTMVLGEVLPASTLIVAVDPGKVSNRVWVSDGSGLLIDPCSVSVLREGLDEVTALMRRYARETAPVVAVECTGSLHRAWVAELERRFPGSVREFAPSETMAARTQLGARRFKTDDRDCAALTYLARQGAGRRVAQIDAVESLLAAVRHRRGLVGSRRVLKQRMHDQLNSLCPGLSSPPGHGRVLELSDTSGQAVLACAVAFGGRPPTVRSLRSRAPGRLTDANARFWVERWKRCLPPPTDAPARAARLGADLARYQQLQRDIGDLEQQITVMLAATDGQVLVSLPGVAATRAAAFAAHSLPIDRYPDAERLYSATGLAPASYQSASIQRRGPSLTARLADHRDALMSIAWGLSQSSPSFRERDHELRARGFAPIQARVALARHACRLCYRLLVTQEPFDEQRYRRNRHSRGR